MLNKVVSRGLGLMSLAALLVGCGAEREEPFSPSEPEEVRTALTVSFVHDDQISDRFSQLPVVDPDVASRRLEVIRDQEDFEELINAYTFNDVFVDIPDFEEGQVVMYDSGWYDNSACAQQLTLNRVQAFSITEDDSIGEVVLRYNRSPVDEDANCPEEVPLRQWEFHYIETRADLILVEEVRGLDEGGGSASSASSSVAADDFNDSSDVGF